MAVQSLRIPITNYSATRSVVSVRKRDFTNNTISNHGKVVAAKIAFQASLEKALLSQKYWDDLLEKLRKSGGGGGGGDSRFDRILVSMMLTNFLSNKTIQAMLRNLTGEFFKNNDFISNYLKNLSQMAFVSNFVKVIQPIFKGIIFVMQTLTAAKNVVIKNALLFVSQLVVFASAISFQMNKLKEILEDELKKLIRKSDLKGKIRKVKESLVDFLLEIREEIQVLFDFFKLFIKKSFTFNQYRNSADNT